MSCNKCAKLLAKIKELESENHSLKIRVFANNVTITSQSVNIEKYRESFDYAILRTIDCGAVN